MITYPNGTEQVLGRNLAARTRAVRSLLRQRLREVLGRPGATAADIADVIEVTRRTMQLMASPSLSARAATAMGIEAGVRRELAALVREATGQDVAKDPRLAVTQALAEGRRLAWAQRMLEEQLRIEGDLFDRARRKAAEVLARGRLDLVPELVDEQAAQTERRLHGLARHEVGNWVAEVTSTQSRALGIRRYRWMSEKDERVRELHRKLDGTIRSWDDPHPTEGHPGQARGCRCTAQPVAEDLRAPKPSVASRRPAKAPKAPGPLRPHVEPSRVAPRPARPLEIPRLPELPQWPARPELPLPRIPTGVSLPRLPEVSTVRGLPRLPEVGARPSRPALPKIELPKVPKAKPARTPKARARKAPAATPSPTPALLPVPPPAPVVSRPTAAAYATPAEYRAAARRWWFEEPGGSVLPGLVTEHPSATDAAANQPVYDTLGRLPAQVQALVAKRGARVTVAATVGDWDPSLKGVRPRGWPPGATWDDVRGLASGQEAVVAVRGRVGGRSLENVTTHELGHAVDKSARRPRSLDPRFVAVYDEAVKSGALKAWAVADRANYSYFVQEGAAGPSEMWAEAFSVGYDPERRAVLDKHCPGLLDALAEVANDDDR